MELSEWKVSVQSLIDHIKTAIDVDPWAKEMVEELLKKQEAVKPIPPTDDSDLWKCGNCNHQLFRCTHQRYCEMCGRNVKWE
jgi:hypothetical protein